MVKSSEILGIYTLVIKTHIYVKKICIKILNHYKDNVLPGLLRLNL